jgi:hypothetical protein
MLHIVAEIMFGFLSLMNLFQIKRFILDCYEVTVCNVANFVTGFSREVDVAKRLVQVLFF